MLQRAPRRFDPQLLDCFRRSDSELLAKDPRQVPRTLAGPPRERWNGEIVRGVLGRPRDEVTHRRCLRALQPERRAVLALVARPAQVHDHRSRDGERQVGSEVFLDQRERQVDPGAHARRRVHAAISHPDAILFDVHAWIAAGQLAGARPVRGRRPPVEQTCLCEQERTGADRTDPPYAAAHPAEPLEHGSFAEQRIDPDAADNEQCVDGSAQAAERRVGEESETRRGGERP